MDINRGVTLKGGVYMYKDDPGVYLMGDDVKVPEALAKAEGFDVKLLAKERAIKLGREAAEAEIAALRGEDVEVLETANGFEYVRTGDGYLQRPLDRWPVAVRRGHAGVACPQALARRYHAGR